MSDLVIDTGVAVAWFIAESEGGPSNGDAAVALLSAAQRGRLTLHAPQLLLPEFGNVLWKLTRFRELPAAQAARNLALLRAVRLRYHPHQGLADAALTLANTLGCSVYDGTYLALAERLGANLVTTDERLVSRVQSTHPWVRALGAL